MVQWINLLRYKSFVNKLITFVVRKTGVVSLSANLTVGRLAGRQDVSKFIKLYAG